MELLKKKKYPNNKKEKREREYRKDGINRKQISIIDLKLTISIRALNVNGVNTPK